MYLCNPKVTQRALEIGAWQTVGDYKSWLTDNHDLRQQICGVPVDLGSVGKIASVLGSGAAVVLGYGTIWGSHFGGVKMRVMSDVVCICI